MRFSKALAHKALFGLLAIVAAIGLMPATVDRVVQAQDAPLTEAARRQPLTEAVLRQWLVTYRNWTRWDNQLGAANFITAKKRREAARQVREGISVGLAHPLLDVAFDPTLPFIPEFPSIAPMPTVPLDPDNGNPFFHWMNPTSFTSDRYNVSYHGTGHSHLDALCHYTFDYGTAAAPDFRTFGGLVRSVNNTADGCAKFGVENLINGVVTRGVLFDATLLPGMREVINGVEQPWLALGTRVTREHLEELEKIEHVKVESGDVILLYTGRWARRAALGPWGTADGVAGYYVDTVPFIFEREVSFIGHDMWNDVAPGGFPNFNNLPVHTFAIDVMGVDIFDNLDLERLAATAREQRRYHFMFTAAPSPVTGGTGSPLNPIATF